MNNKARLKQLSAAHQIRCPCSSAQMHNTLAFLSQIVSVLRWLMIGASASEHGSEIVSPRREPLSA